MTALDLKQAAQILNYHSLGEDDGYFVDFGGMSTRDWFHANSERFLFPLEAVRAASKPYKYPPWGCGVYFLFFDDAFQYVGLSKNINLRLREHQKKSWPDTWFNRYTALWVPEYLMKDVESYYIHTFHPPANDQVRAPEFNIRRYLNVPDA